jgi:tRNA threonylcarbamoyladenosine biosynthesis protein TsaB
VTGFVLALMDAGRGEVFAGTYEIAAAQPQLRPVAERLTRIDQLSTAEAHHMVTPDPGLAEVLRGKGIDAELVERPRTDVIARLGWPKIQAGNTVTAEQLEANYIRQSDAEIFFKPQG